MVWLFVSCLIGSVLAWFLANRVFMIIALLLWGSYYIAAIYQTFSRPVDIPLLLFAFSCSALPCGLLLMFMEWDYHMRRQVEAQAWNIVQARLAERKTLPALDLVWRCRVRQEDIPNALAIIEGMARILSGGKNKLCPTDSLLALIRIKTADLLPEQEKLLKWSSYKEFEWIWTHDGELAEFFESRIRYDQWDKPLYDDDLEDFLFTASICELLNTFAPLFGAEQA